MTTHVALVDLPALLADVVRDALAGDPDVEVQVLPDGTAPDAILAQRLDVAVVGASDPGHCDCAEPLLRRRPDLGLIAISPDARQAWIHQISVTASQLSEVTGPSLRAAVHRAAERGRADHDPDQRIGDRRHTPGQDQP